MREDPHTNNNNKKQKNRTKQSLSRLIIEFGAPGKKERKKEE